MTSWKFRAGPRWKEKGLVSEAEYEALEKRVAALEKQIQGQPEEIERHIFDALYKAIKVD